MLFRKKYNIIYYYCINMANIPINTATQFNGFLRQLIGLQVGANNAITPLAGPPGLNAGQTCKNNVYNFCRPVIYSVLNATGQMGQNNTPLQELINLIGPNYHNEFNTFYKAIFFPYTGITLNATAQNLWDKVERCIVNPLLVPINPQGTRACGPVIYIGGGEAVNSYTLYKYHSLRTNDTDTKLTHRKYYTNGQYYGWTHTDNFDDNYFYDTTNGTAANIPHQNNGNPPNITLPLTRTGTAQRMFLFRSFFFFILQRALNEFYIIAGAGTQNPGAFAAQYGLNNNCSIRTLAQVNMQGAGRFLPGNPWGGNGNNWLPIFSGNTTILNNIVARSMNREVMKIFINIRSGGENLDGDSIIDNVPICSEWVRANNPREGADLGVHKFMDPNYNPLVQNIWTRGAANQQWQARDGPNYAYTFLNLRPTVMRPANLNTLPPAFIGASVAFNGYGLPAGWVAVLSANQRIPIVTLGYLIWDQYRMIITAYYMQVAQNNQNSILKYRQKVSSLLGTLGLTDIDQFVYDMCQAYRISSANQNPAVGAYFGGAPTNSNQYKDDFEANTPMIEGAQTIKMAEDEENEEKEKEIGEVDRFDTLTPDEIKQAINFSKKLFEKEKEIGEENMSKYMSENKTTNDIEFYGYLNYVALNNPDFSDYKLGFPMKNEISASNVGGKRSSGKKTIKLNKKKGKKTTRRQK